MMLLAAALAALVGLSLGLLGGGGSILTVPIFVYVLGFETKQAIAASLAVVGAVSLFGAAGHWREGNLNLRLAGTFGAVAMAGTFLGARLGTLLSGAVQMTLFAGMMLIAAFLMARPDPFQRRWKEGREVIRRLPPRTIVIAGLCVGMMTGLVGVGGGFMIVPALVLLGHVPMKQAVGTSLLVIAMNSAVGFLGYAGHVDVPWGTLVLFTAVAIGGILTGTRLSRSVPQRTLKRVFAVFLVVIATFILYKNRGVFLPGAPETRAASAKGAGSESIDPVFG